MTADMHIAVLIERHPELAAIRPDVIAVCRLLETSLRTGHTLFVCGNGGSASDAEHIVGELVKDFTIGRPLDLNRRRRLLECCTPEDGPFLSDNLQRGLRAVSLTGHPALSSAIANDRSATLVFAQQIAVYGQPGDLLLALSTSGNARNVVLAAQTARAFGLRVAGLTGETGGELATWCDAAIRVPAVDTARVQEYHVCVYHALCAWLEVRFFGRDDERP